MIRLTLLEEDGEKPREFPADVVTIGRSHTNALELKEPSISRLHCEVALVNGKVMLINHAKTNGTLVNGKPVGEALLKAGDLIVIGRIRLRFEGAGEGSIPSAPAAPESGLRKKLLRRRPRE